MSTNALDTILNILQDEYNVTYSRGQIVYADGKKGVIAESFGQPWLLRQGDDIFYRVVFENQIAKFIPEENITLVEKTDDDPPKKNLPPDKEIQKWLDTVWDDPEFKKKHGSGWEGVAFAMAWDKYNEKHKKNDESFQTDNEILREVAPPDEDIEDWIKKMKTKHVKKWQERYGDDWKSVIYAKAWKMYNKESVSESRRENKAAWQLDPSSIETDRVQLWLASGSMETAQLSKKKAQEYVKSGKAYVISAQAIGLYESLNEFVEISQDSEFVADVYAIQNSMFRDFTGSSVNHFTRGRIYFAKKDAGDKDVLVNTSRVPYTEFMNLFSFEPVTLDGNLN